VGIEPLRLRLIGFLILAATLGSGPPALALTIIPPRSLAEMAASADAVVLALAGPSLSVPQGALYSTLTDFVVLRQLSGGFGTGESFTVKVPGGTVDGEEWKVFGAPRFTAGESYLLSLRRKPDGLWSPVLLAYGVLRETRGVNGESLLVPADEAFEVDGAERPDGEQVDPVGSYREEALLDQLQDVLWRGTRWDPDLSRAAPEIIVRQAGGGAVPAGCVYFNQNNMNYRWRTFDTGGIATIRADSRGDLSLPGGGFRQIQDAMNLWMGVAGTSVNLQFGGPVDVSINCAAGGAARDGVIIFNDPCSEEDPGVLAVGGPVANGSHSFDGANWWTITGWILIVNDGAGGVGVATYPQLLAHELGHGLGFGHSADSTSIMWGVCCHPINTLDRTCVSYTYPASTANQRPVVNAGGDRSIALAGETLFLDGAATDDGLPAGGTFTTTWRQLGGPRGVTFADASALDTAVTFPGSGKYLLGLSAHDGRLLRVNQAEITVDTLVGSKVVTTFRQGTAGYAGTSDTMILQSSPAAKNGSALALSTDADDPGGSGQTTQSLLRFDGIFGDGPGQVPAGVKVLTATLELNTADKGSGASLHRMLVDWTENDSWSTFGGNGIQTGAEALAAVDGTASGQDDTTRIDVTSSLAAWSQDPCSNRGWVFLPAGTDGWDFSSSESGSPPRLTVEYSIVRDETLIKAGDSWRYFKGLSQPPADWSHPGFVLNGSWLTGATGIGYADADDKTVLTDMINRYLTIYCRREFTVTKPATLGRLYLDINYDDGFVAYLNGGEVARSASMGKPGAPVDRNTLSADHEAGVVETYRIPAAGLVEGTNVLAVEVHNGSLGSSDLSFIPSLRGQRLIISDDAEWKFLRGSAPRPADWNALEFDDSSWESGPAGIGFGGGDDATVLDDMKGSYISVALRKAFQVEDPGAPPPILTVIHDDGVVVYLNGTELGRATMPAGAFTPQTAASQSIDPVGTRFVIPPGRLKAGTNVLAASIHNASVSNADLSFNCVLVAAPASGSPVNCSGTFRRGDVQGDRVIDLSDPLRLLYFLFQAEAITCPDAADFDDDGVIEISDVIGLLDYLFRSGAAPAAPGPTCGPDPTVDSLGECTASGCSG
jgi:matrixin